MNIFKIYTVKNPKNTLDWCVPAIYIFLNMAASDKTNLQNNTEQFPGIIRNFYGISLRSFDLLKYAYRVN